jgi:hypothetical protein
MSGLEFIVALITVAEMAFKLAEKIRDVSETVASSRTQIMTFGFNVLTFSDAISVACRSLTEHCTENSDLRAIRTINSNNSVANLNKYAKIIIIRIEKIRPNMEQLQTKFSWLSRIKWYYKRPEVEGLRLDMESFKSTLVLILATVALEIAKRNASFSSPDSCIEYYADGLI